MLQATKVFTRRPLNEDLCDIFKSRATQLSSGHGYYLPALDAALEVLRPDACNSAHIFLVFLSDGAPSDHNVSVFLVQTLAHMAS